MFFEINLLEQFLKSDDRNSNIDHIIWTSFRFIIDAWNNSSLTKFTEEFDELYGK